ncbi:MAG: NAD(P)-binding domain-containing protein [Candidatus Bathyarchaeota archaeon]|nr:NAD(P)-binding domain-containing protein [Candidatus Bathyarchaeota archaeon]
MKVCVVGLGQIGFPVAQYVHEKGMQVWGYDISAATVEHANQGGQFKATNSWSEIPSADVYIVCVTTGQVDGCPDLKAVFNVCQKISEKAASSTLVTIESTVVPGTARKIFTEIFNSQVNLVHAPHRYWADEPEEHGVNQIRVIGAVNEESLASGMEFYEGNLGIPMHVCGSAEVAEMCKITENSHRYLQIAFAEDLKMLCGRIGMDFEDLRAACNTKWNVAIPEARDGIGRHCLPKDIRYVMSMAPSTLLESALRVDKEYRAWLSKRTP